VWFFLEQKGVNYATKRVHLRSDPCEPPKPDWYLELVPSGVVPAIELDGIVITESLDIMRALERAFPAPCMLPPASEARLLRLAETSDRYDCDGDDWLHNVKPGREATLRAAALTKLGELEADLAAEGGPFFGCASPTLADAAFVGFLTRLAHNYKFFKGLDVLASEPRDCFGDDAPEGGFPHLRRWFAAMACERGYVRTRGEAAYEQRIYQARPDRRATAEPCMRLQRGAGVGEAAWAAPPVEVTPLAAVSQSDALDAARVLCDRRGALLGFLRRKAAERGEAERDGGGKSYFGRASEPETRGELPSEPETRADAVDDDDSLRAVAGLLASMHGPQPFFDDAGGDCGAGAAAAAAGGVSVLLDENSPVSLLPGHIGTPRDMRVDVAAAIRGAIRAMQDAVAARPPSLARQGIAQGAAATLAEPDGDETGDDDDPTADLEMIAFE